MPPQYHIDCVNLRCQQKKWICEICWSENEIGTTTENIIVCHYMQIIYTFVTCIHVLANQETLKSPRIYILTFTWRQNFVNWGDSQVDSKCVRDHTLYPRNFQLPLGQNIFSPLHMTPLSYLRFGISQNDTPHLGSATPSELNRLQLCPTFSMMSLTCYPMVMWECNSVAFPICTKKLQRGTSYMIVIWVGMSGGWILWVSVWCRLYVGPLVGWLVNVIIPNWSQSPPSLFLFIHLVPVGLLESSSSSDEGSEFPNAFDCPHEMVGVHVSSVS